MRAKWLLASLSLLAFCIPSVGVAQANLPDSFQGWHTKTFQAITPAQLPFLAGDDAPLLLEYGFVSGQQREYGKEAATLAVTLWEMKDVSGSFGLFTFLQESGMTRVEAADPVLAAPEHWLLRGGREVVEVRHWLLRRGRYVVEVRGEGLQRDEAPLLLSKIPPPRPSENLLPSVPVFLPEKDLVAGSTKFLMGPVALERMVKQLPASRIGFDLGAEAAFAHYRMDGRIMQLLLVSYATPQLAAKKLRDLQELPVLASKEEEQNVFLLRKGSLLCIALNVPGPDTADKLLNRVRYESVITWNQYVPRPSDNVGNLMLAAFLLTGFVLLITLFAGIFFGGIRLLAKKFLPWAIFDRPEQMEVIQLHIYGK